MRSLGRLRPAALDDLGLRSALAALTNADQGAAGPVSHARASHVDPALPALDPDVELVLYRVAQESLTDAARHARARQSTCRCARGRGGAARDRRRWGRDGEGGCGIRGMRERALLIGAELGRPHATPAPRWVAGAGGGRRW